MTASGSERVAASSVSEERVERELVTFEQRSWQGRFPRLACGITGAENEDEFGIAAAQTALDLLRSYRALAATLGFGTVALCRQRHGAEVLLLPDREAGFDRAGLGETARPAEAAVPAVHVSGDADGLVTKRADLLLAVTVADCVPVFLFDPARGAVALLHAGWRGVSAGILERGLDVLSERFGSRPCDVRLHLGPAICGDCYEVGEEVRLAVGRRGPRGAVDLREILAERACRAGISERLISCSPWCTRCNPDRFHSHRAKGAEAGRMAAFIGLCGA